MNVYDFSNDLKELMKKYNIKSISPLTMDAEMIYTKDDDLLICINYNFQFQTEDIK